MTPSNNAEKIRRAVENAPDWLKLDLLSKDSAVRARAEETLAARIQAALVGSSNSTV